MTFSNEKDPTFIIKMKSGYAYMGYNQFLPGYCILVADPKVETLNDLNSNLRTEFLSDMGLLGDAIISVCEPLRINYGILGNSYTNLHAHLFPRFSWEPEEQKTKNVWRYPEEYWIDKNTQFNNEEHNKLKQELTAAIKNLM